MAVARPPPSAAARRRAAEDAAARAVGEARNNVGIFLAKRLGKMSAAQLCDGVLALDDAVLTADMLEALLLNLSDEPEAKALRALRVAPEELAPAELLPPHGAGAAAAADARGLRLRLALPAP